MDLIFLRHTTPHVAPGTCYGRTDLDLADSFADEAQAVASVIPKASHIVSSPLKRCRKLAEHLSRTFSLPMEVEPRLTEMDFGSWEGLPWSDIPRAQLDAWAKDFLHARPHDGETVAELHARVMDLISELKNGRERTLLVTHAGIIKAAFATGDEVTDYQTTVEFGGHITLSLDKGEVR